MNAKEYAAVIDAVNRDSQSQSDPAVQRILAQAHLGAGGFELLPLLRRVLGSQAGLREISMDYWVNNANCPQDEVKMDAKAQLSFACVFERLLNATEPEDSLNDRGKSSHLHQARDIYARNFQNFKSQSVDLNFEFTIATILDAIVHLRTFEDPDNWRWSDKYLSLNEEDQMVHDTFVLHHARGSLRGLLGALKSLRFSYPKFADLIKAQDGKTLLQINGVKLSMSEDFNEESLAKFFSEVHLSFYQTIEKSLTAVQDKILVDLQNRVGNSPLARLSQHIENTVGSGPLKNFAASSRKLNDMIGGVLAPQPGKKGFMILSFEQNYNPRVAELGTALRTTWFDETTRPLRSWELKHREWIRYVGNLYDRGAHLEYEARQRDVKAFAARVSDKWANRREPAQLNQHKRDSIVAKTGKRKPAQESPSLPQNISDIRSWLSTADEMVVNESVETRDWYATFKTFLNDAATWSSGEIPAERDPASLRKKIKASS